MQVLNCEGAVLHACDDQLMAKVVLLCFFLIISLPINITSVEKSILV
jgi:hypothetical protein